MNLLLSDTKLPDRLPDCKDNFYIDLNEKNIHHCIGCFGCWVKTPGRCVIRDDAVGIYPLIARSNRLLYVTRLFYGSYDEPMKRILERAIPVQQAFIRVHNRETHHVQRNVAEKRAVIIAYGDIPEEEQALFQKLIARNANNMMFSDWKIRFVPESEVETTIVSEVEAWQNS